MLCPEYGTFVCELVERLPTTDTGQPFRLYDWQRDALMEFYSTLDDDGETGERLRRYQYLYLEIPKKNGKSELAAALGLYHLFGDGELNAEVYICAADRDNASIVFNAAVFMLETAPWTAKMLARGELKIVRSQKRVEYRQMKKAENGAMRWTKAGEMAVLSSESYSKHGYKPSCVIFDELHAQKTRDLWDIMTFGAGSGRLQPVWIVLTTAGDDPDRKSVGWEQHERAVAIRDARELRRVLAEGGDPRQVLSLRDVDEEGMEAAQTALLGRDEPNWLPVLYGLTALYGDDPDELAKIDIWDEALWYRCNPSLGRHLKLRTLRLEAQAAKKSAAAEKLFRWLRLNQWISVKAVGWIPLPIYDKTQWGPSAKAEREEQVGRLRGKKCYGGLDLSTTTDLTALTLLFPPQEGLDTWVAMFRAWRPEEGVEDAENRDHVPYRDWERAGFIELCPGDMIDFTQVEEAVYAAAEQYELAVLGVDPYLSRTLTQRLMAASGADGQPKRAVKVIEIPQTLMSLSPAMKELERLIRAHEMLHVHNTAARWCFGNVRCYVDANENMRPMKNKSIGRIDMTVAWIIAMAVAMTMEPAGSDINAHVLREDWSL